MDAQLQERIRQYASEARLAQDVRMDVDATEMEARLDRTIQQLHERMKEQQQALEQLLSSSKSFPTHPSSNPRERLQQLRTLKTAYESLAESTPSLPTQGSALPPILAAYLVQEAIVEGERAVDVAESQLAGVTARAKREEDTLYDARQLTDALGQRIEQLQNQRDEQSRKNPGKSARDMLGKAQRRKKNYRREAQGLQKALYSFIDNHLARMLAAEDLGGPVVGNMMDIDEDVLIGGFSSQGKARKGTNVSEDKRQRRIDQIWGSSGREEVSKESKSELEASAQEIKELFEELMETLGNKDDSGLYLELSRDSAATRFLARAKVVQFHPKDAHKIKLVDFGRELDD